MNKGEMEQQHTEAQPSSGRWTLKRILTVIIVLALVVILVFAGTMMYLVSREIVRDVTTVNPEGTTGDAFVVIRPGITDFQDEVTEQFVEGLEENNWSVDMTSSHANTPTDLEEYDMFVFGSPTYGEKPHDSIIDYLERVDLQGKPSVILYTSAGSPGDGPSLLHDAVTGANGTVVGELSLFTQNNPDGEPMELAYQLGLTFTAIP